ncbi:MAG: hypothetical protein ABUL72_05595, partial [Armatimonadota bacterium]
MTPVKQPPAYLARSPLDNVLTAISGALATYSLGMSVSKPLLAQGLSTAVIIASIIGFVLSNALKKSPVIKLDGWIMTFMALVLACSTGAINNMLGDEGLPPQIIAGVFFSFLLIFGS